MSTTPQHPHHPQTKAPRRSGRKNKNHDHMTAIHPNGVVSDNDFSAVQTDGVGESSVLGRRSHYHPGSAKQQRIPSGNISDVTTERARATPTKSTPMKAHQAYAGATFTNSPAASALPLPSFYSRSVPNVSQPPPRPGTADPESKAQGQQPPLHDVSPSKHEPTPLDFLFHAARQARAVPRGQSPSANSCHLSLAADSPQSHSPAPREGESVFPFELDATSVAGEESDAFSTPSYKDRIAALRNGQSVPSKSRDQISEAERQEKTAALKKLLIKENLPSPSAESPDTSNPFNARPPQPTLYSQPASHPPGRFPSMPSTPGRYGPASISSPPNGHPPFSPAVVFPQYAANNHHRQASGLRHHVAAVTEPELVGLPSDSAVARAARLPTARATSQPGTPVAPEPGSHQTKPSIAQMEEQMRTFLKLDVVSKG